jgi:hypothetical protein
MESRRISLRWLLSLAALAAALALIAVAIADHAAAGPAAAAKPPPVVHGVIKYQGKLMKGVEVVLSAEPQSSVLEKIKPGKTVPFKVIGTAKTNQKGYYAIRVAAAGLKQARAYSLSRQHVVNLQVQAFDMQLSSQFWFSRQFVRGALGGLHPGASVAQELAPQVANLTLTRVYIPHPQ